MYNVLRIIDAKVVADGVRKLAADSALSANQITEVVKTIQDAVSSVDEESKLMKTRK